ncbi:MAG TPA: sensor histidine kinase, partial [Selenomonas sp.]|nr:sensor histidine kinase [Selenomonas sp.]
AVSHELRTPLTVMRGTWELLESGLVNDEAKAASYRGRISENLLMLERLVGDLLELTRLQNPGFEIEMQELDLTEPFRDAVRSGTSLGEKKGVEVRESMPESIPFMGDYGRLRQLLLILLDNGVKFSTEGSTVTVNGKLEDETWQVSVEDKGRGIAPEDIPHIFERFKTDNEGNSGGTGLGLAIAGEIAQRHGIVIKCESTLGKGTRFTLEGSCIPQYQGNFQYRRNGSIS